MIRTLALAFATVAAIGAVGLSSTDAFAKGKGGWHRGGFHVGIGHGWHHGHGWRHSHGWRHGYGWPHRYWAPGLGLYAYEGCYEVLTRRGLRMICSY